MYITKLPTSCGLRRHLIITNAGIIGAEVFYLPSPGQPCIMSEISIKRVCCTCIATDRKLYQLCRILDGINLLYMLLSRDPEAYKEGFYKDSSSLFVCWECRATIHRIKKFQAQVCFAQKCLTSIADGRNDTKLQTLSHLSHSNNETPQYEFQSYDATENFVDCGPVKEIKTESDSDDIPLSVFYNENDSDDDAPGNEATKPGNEATKPGNVNIASKTEPLKRKPIDTDYFNTLPLKPGNQSDPSNNTEATVPPRIEVTSMKKTKMKYSKYFTISTMDEAEILKSVEKNKMLLKSDTCLIEFKTGNELVCHHTEFKTGNELVCPHTKFHEKKDNHSQCNICHAFTEEFNTDRQTHYQCYRCVLCTHIAYAHIDIIRHFKRNHKEIYGGKKKVSKRKRNGIRLDDISKYPCPECEFSFQNKDLRWKHVQKAHREGYKCITCDKKFAFKNNLERHERIHQGPLPREECPVCHKMIRTDLVKVHSRTHTDRQRHTCVECDKSFVSRATYESHLKYARAHATGEVCRHKCPSCHKRYRSGGELRDHVNYQHNGQADHKCPICGKGLATKRCIRRHVRRAHEGVKESAKDKICQQCGKAFRDKKGLIEHERVHTGARPLACAACGRAFRQRAALYAHTKRVHRATHNTS